MKKTFALLLALVFCFSMTGCATIATLAFDTAVKQTVTEEDLLVSEEENSSESIEESITDFADDILEEYLDSHFGEGSGEMITHYLEEQYGEDFEAELRRRLEETYGENYEEVIREYLEENFDENFEQELKDYIGGSISDYFVEDPVKSADSVEDSASEPMPESAAELTVEDLVTTAYEIQLQGTDSVGNEYDCTYRIPAFTFDTPEAQDVNTYLMNWLLPYIEEQQANHEAGCSISIRELDYDAWTYDGILTVLIFVNTDWSQSYYQVYSVDIYTGEFLDNTDILAKLGFTEDMYYDALYSAIESMYDTTAAEIVGLEFLEQQLESTLSEENLRAATLFFDDTGCLKLHLTIYPLAGPSTYETIIDLPIG